MSAKWAAGLWSVRDHRSRATRLADNARSRNRVAQRGSGLRPEGHGCARLGNPAKIGGHFIGGLEPAECVGHWGTMSTQGIQPMAIDQDSRPISTPRPELAAFGCQQIEPSSKLCVVRTRHRLLHPRLVHHFCELGLTI
jgi:hypothetical protein